MAFAGPSIIGLNTGSGTSSGGIFPYVQTAGYVSVSGPNQSSKLIVVDSAGNNVFSVDTTPDQINAGASIIPTNNASFDLGSAGSAFRNIYVSSLVIAGLPANRVVITDGAGAVTASLTLPPNVLATSMTLTSPLLSGAASGWLCKREQVG